MSDAQPSAQTLASIAHQTQSLVDAETAVVALSEDEGNVIFYAAAVGKHAAAVQGKRGARETSGLCAVAFDSQHAELVCQTQGDVRVRQDIVEALGINTALAVPIIQNGWVLGALMVLNRRDGQPFDDTAKHDLETYAQKVAALL
jgi:signal transduction protein with GAF and PtsI domain